MVDSKMHNAGGVHVCMYCKVSLGIYSAAVVSRYVLSTLTCHLDYPE